MILRPKNTDVAEPLLVKAAQMAQLGIWTLDPKTNHLTWSEEVFRIHELPVGTPPDLEQAIRFYPPEARASVTASVERLLTRGEPFDFELPLITAKGNRIWVRSIGEMETRGREPSRICGVFQDITERRVSIDELRRRENRWWLALDGAEDGVWDWDLVTDKVYFSDGWKALLGYAPHEIENTIEEWNRRLHPADRQQVMTTVRSHLSGDKKIYSCEHRLRHRDGSWRTFLGRGKIVAWDDDRKPTRFIGTQTDITEQVRAREELVLAKENAEAAARAKSEFLAVMSHEIRTPLNAVLGMAQLLCEAPLTPELREYAGAIHSSGDHLLSILNDLLDSAKIEAGAMILEREPFDLRDSLTSILDLHHSIARRKGIDLRLVCDEQVPPQFLGDVGRIKQIVHNLIGNALKFTESGSIEIRVAPAHPSVPDRSRIRFEIRDTGPGIDEETCSRIFRSFSQADASTTRKHGGTGLGLSICRQLTELMGGGIGVTSEVGKGSEFWFELDLDVTDAPAVEASAFHLDTGGIEPGIRVLVVEDHRVNQLVARRLLERIGCQTDIAANGEEGVEMASRFSYDVIFMDCSMPVMDGYEAAGLITAMPSPPPIIAMTANVFPEDRERCKIAGMIDFVPKPIQLQNVTGALHRCGVTGPGGDANPEG